MKKKMYIIYIHKSNICINYNSLNFSKLLLIISVHGKGKMLMQLIVITN